MVFEHCKHIKHRDMLSGYKFDMYSIMNNFIQSKMYLLLERNPNDEYDIETLI